MSLSQRLLAAPLLVALAVVLAGCPDVVTPPVPPVPPVLSPPPPDEPPPSCVQNVGPRQVKLLTRAELDRTLRDLLGDPTAPATALLPPETAIIGFENDADNHRATSLMVEDLLRMAEDVAARALGERRDFVLSCDPAVIGEVACGAAFIDDIGARAFRRPLTAGERDRLLGLFQASRAAYGFDEAVRLTLVSMLVSPAFLYRVDLGAPADDDENASLASSYEMASRLSYFLWGTMPDAELFEAAARGELLDAAGVEVQARRMLDTPDGQTKARQAVGSFFRQWLGLERIDGVTKDAATFPEYNAELNDKWRASLLAYVENVVFDGSGTLDELFTSPTLYVDPVLAALYDVDGADHVGFEPSTAPAGTRAGLLTQPGLMALLANPDQSSPIRRGVFVREKILCQPIPPPPADVVIEPPTAAPGLTTRERFAAHTAAEECAACHVMIDPIGFGFEGYDALGRYRTEENGLPVDVSGALELTDDVSVEGPFNGALELSQKLAASSMVRDCVLGQAFTYAVGRVADPVVDQCALDEVRARFAETSSLREMLIAIATSEAFRSVSSSSSGGAP